jgi:hypothetical protein
MKPESSNLPTPAADFFADVATLRVSDSTSAPLVRPVLTHIPVRKPSKEWYFRIHPEIALDTLILETKDEGEVLLVSPALQEQLLGEKCVGVRTLRLGVTKQGTPFIWPVRRPMEGRRDSWATTALDAISYAEKQWVRMQADMNLGGYTILVARVDDEPRWPEEEFTEILRIAFKGAVVDSMDHPTLKRLRGEL